jgi:hypothetical protein
MAQRRPSLRLGAQGAGARSAGGRRERVRGRRLAGARRGRAGHRQAGRTRAAAGQAGRACGLALAPDASAMAPASLLPAGLGRRRRRPQFGWAAPPRAAGP